MIHYDPMMGGFPLVVYHPVHGAYELKDANEAVTLGADWFNTPEDADMHRTEAEALLVVHNHNSLKVKESAELGAVVRNSVAETEAVKALALANEAAVVVVVAAPEAL